MKAEALIQFPHLSLTLAAMLIFLIVFIGLIAWAYFAPNAPKQHQQLAQMPLLEEEISNE